MACDGSTSSAHGRRQCRASAQAVWPAPAAGSPATSGCAGSPAPAPSAAPGHAVAQLQRIGCDATRRSWAWARRSHRAPGARRLGARALRPGGRRRDAAMFSKPSAPAGADVASDPHRSRRRTRRRQRRVDRVRVVVGRPRVERQRPRLTFRATTGRSRRFCSSRGGSSRRSCAASRRPTSTRAPARPSALRGAVVVAVARVRRGPPPASAGRRRPARGGGAGAAGRRSGTAGSAARYGSGRHEQSPRTSGWPRRRRGGRYSFALPLSERPGARPEQARQQARGAVGVARAEPLEAPPVDRRVEAPRGGAPTRARRAAAARSRARPRPRPAGRPRRRGTGRRPRPAPRAAAPRPARRRRVGAGDEAARRRGAGRGRRPRRTRAARRAGPAGRPRTRRPPAPRPAPRPGRRRPALVSSAAISAGRRRYC